MTILIALTSHSTLGETGRPTGFYVSEAAHPWQVFTDAGHGVEVVSVRGGEPPRDGEDHADPVQRAFLDAVPLTATPSPDEVDPARYTGLLFAGGHGTMWDFPDCAPLAALARDIYERGGVIGAVCHGPAGLVNVVLSDGSHLVDGRALAAFTNDEERAVGLTDVVPFSLQDRLSALGAKHSAALEFQPWVVRDGRLVTGQNPASAVGVAQEMLVALGERGSAPRDRSPRAVTESYFAAENRRDLDGILANFAADARFVAPDGRVLADHDAIRSFFAENAAGMPELRVELIDAVIDGDRGALQWQATGRTPDGSAVHMHGVNMVTVANGQFTDFFAYWLSGARAGIRV